MKYRLPKEFAEKWISALRSGEYKQCRGYLFDGEGHCCLGVAAKIAGHDLEPKEYALLDATVFDKVPGEIKEPDRVACNELANDLSTMNDSGKTFKKIANWIEKNVELYENNN